VGFGEADHGFELARCGSDAALGCADVLAEFAHGDIGFDELGGGGFGDDGLAVGAGKGDVGCEEFDWLVLLVSDHKYAD